MRKPMVTALESRKTARLGYLPPRLSPQKPYHNELQATEQPYPTTDTMGARLPTLVPFSSGLL